jgi:hypothetical protein
VSACDINVATATMAPERIARRLNRIGHSLLNSWLVDFRLCARRFPTRYVRVPAPSIAYDYTNI